MSVLQDNLQTAQVGDRVSTQELNEIIAKAPHSDVEFGVPPGLAEQFRALRENIELLGGVSKIRTVAVTSSVPGEGVSTVASFLAASFARIGTNQHRTLEPPATTERPMADNGNGTANVQGESGLRTPGGRSTNNRLNPVLLLDANLRKPSIDKILGLNQEPGLSDVVENGLGWPKALQLVNEGRLTVLAAGSASVQQDECLSSPRVKRLLDELRDRFMRVVIDLPPVTSSVEALRVSQWVDGVVLVVRAGRTRIEVARNALEKLVAAKARILGVVLNRRQLVIPGPIYRAL